MVELEENAGSLPLQATSARATFRVCGITCAWPAALSALQHRNYRLFLSGQLVSLIGTWMQNAAQGWLVLLLATSEFGASKASLYVGLVSALGTLPIFLFCLLAGVLSDRQDRRRILIITQISLMLLAAGLALLTASGKVHLWQVAIFSMLSGLVMAFDMPTRQAFVKDMSSPKDLLNAIALNSTIFNLARIFGPAVAGRIIKDPHFGIPGALYINAASFLAVIIGLFMIRVPPVVRRASDGNVWQRLGEGFRYTARHKTIRLLMIIMAAVSIFGFSYAVLMSVIAVQVFRQDSSGYGVLMGAGGIGACIGAIFLAATAGRIRKGRMLFWSGMLMSTALIVFSFNHNFFRALLLLPFVGAGLVVTSASINSMIQEIVPDHLRGRVVSIWAFIFAGFSPLGALFAGTLAHYTTPMTAVLAGGACCAALFGYLTLRARWLWGAA